jgi:magnesium chelatase subunit D
LRVERADLRVKRYKEKRQTTAIFAVDASGSAALHRMAEAKGAVELILADCYVRRDQAALIAFRGKTAEVLLPPTRSLQRAKKSLADLPGGGGTPLSAGIEQALNVAHNVRRGGGTPLVVFLTDGKANIARDGTADRALALRDAESAASAMKLAGVRTLMIDLSDARGGPARKIAEAMGASYLPLPHADAARISQSVAAAMKS